MLGFTYNGIHCSRFGLYYIPDESDLWFNDPEYNVYQTDISWKNGGYYYDSKAKNRTFTLKCGFEEIDVATRQKIKQWVKMGTSGKLIFDDMPFVFWNVRPGKIPVGNWYLDTNDSHSGTVTITFTAYEPFGYLTRKSNASGADDDGASDYCNMISYSEMPSDPTISSTSFNVYNPGTEECGLTIEISGSASNPIRLFNDANKSQCVLSSLPTRDMHLFIDGDTGYIGVSVNGTTPGANGYVYHDKGFIKLAPSCAYYDTGYSYIGVSGETYTFELIGVPVSGDMLNGKIALENVANTSFTIIGVNQANNRVSCTRTGSGTPASTGECTLYTYNKILIQEKINTAWTTPSTLSLTSIAIDYKPRIL